MSHYPAPSLTASSWPSSGTSTSPTKKASDDQPWPARVQAASAHRKGDPVAVINQAQSNGDDPGPQPKPVTGPILSEARWDGKLTRARAHVAVVVVYQRGDHLVIWPHERKHVLLHRRPATVYEIDLTAPCQND